MNQNILQWETSRSWTGKAAIGDIQQLRQDLSALQQLLSAKADLAALRDKADLRRVAAAEAALHCIHEELAAFKQHALELSRYLQEHVQKLEQWVHSGAIEARLQEMCEKQSQTVEDICAQHQAKISETARVAEDSAGEIRSLITGFHQTFQQAAEMTTKARMASEHALETMERILSETASQAVVAKAVCQESQLFFTQERSRCEQAASQLDAQIRSHKNEIDRSRAELLPIAASLVSLKESVTAASERAELCATSATKSATHAGQLLEQSADHLASCKEALQMARNAQNAQQELERKMRNDLLKAESYRLELRSLTFRAEVSLAKIQHRHESFWDRLRWLLRGPSEST